jgi:hypothetical protein
MQDAKKAGFGTGTSTVMQREEQIIAQEVARKLAPLVVRYSS